MDPTQQTREGYRPIIDKERDPIDRAKFLIDSLRHGRKSAEQTREFNDAIEQSIVNPGGAEDLGVEELSRLPLFMMDGFDGHPPDHYAPGEEPAFAPISKEQMRLLLLRTLPSDLVPFAMERFVFEFDPQTEEDDGGAVGLKVRVEKGSGIDRIHIRFNRDHFYSPGLPYRIRPGEQRNELPKNMVGFIDPSKISVFLGKVIAKMIPPPEKWAEVVTPDFVLLIVI
jgi:hypothetical protein